MGPKNNTAEFNNKIWDYMLHEMSQGDVKEVNHYELGKNDLNNLFDQCVFSNNSVIDDLGVASLFVENEMCSVPEIVDSQVGNSNAEQNDNVVVDSDDDDLVVNSVVIL